MVLGRGDFLRDATGHVRMDTINHENIDHYFNFLKQCLDDNDLVDHPEYTIQHG